MKSREGHTDIWQESLPGRSSSGPKVGEHLVCFKNIKEDNTDRVWWARVRVIKTRSAGSEGVKLLPLGGQDRDLKFYSE